MLILKGVKVVCFDTLSQVLILKVVSERAEISESRAEMGVPSRMVCTPERGMPPRVFCKKSAEVIENKGSECGKERKEKSRVLNLLKT